jgi:hypothetical protein
MCPSSIFTYSEKITALLVKIAAYCEDDRIRGYATDALAEHVGLVAAMWRELNEFEQFRQLQEQRERLVGALKERGKQTVPVAAE